MRQIMLSALRTIRNVQDLDTSFHQEGSYSRPCENTYCRCRFSVWRDRRDDGVEHSFADVLLHSKVKGISDSLMYHGCIGEIILLLHYLPNLHTLDIVRGGGFPPGHDPECQVFAPLAASALGSMSGGLPAGLRSVRRIILPEAYSECALSLSSIIAFMALPEVREIRVSPEPDLLETELMEWGVSLNELRRTSSVTALALDCSEYPPSMTIRGILDTPRCLTKVALLTPLDPECLTPLLESLEGYSASLQYLDFRSVHNSYNGHPIAPLSLAAFSHLKHVGISTALLFGSPPGGFEADKLVSDALEDSDSGGGVGSEIGSSESGRNFSTLAQEREPNALHASRESLPSLRQLLPPSLVTLDLFVNDLWDLPMLLALDMMNGWNSRLHFPELETVTLRYSTGDWGSSREEEGHISPRESRNAAKDFQKQGINVVYLKGEQRVSCTLLKSLLS